MPRPAGTTLQPGPGRYRHTAYEGAQLERCPRRWFRRRAGVVGGTGPAVDGRSECCTRRWPANIVLGHQHLQRGLDGPDGPAPRPEGAVDGPV